MYFYTMYEVNVVVWGDLVADRFVLLLHKWPEHIRLKHILKVVILIDKCGI